MAKQIFDLYEYQFNKIMQFLFKFYQDKNIYLKRGIPNLKLLYQNTSNKCPLFFEFITEHLGGLVTSYVPIRLLYHMY